MRTDNADTQLRGVARIRSDSNAVARLSEQLDVYKMMRNDCIFSADAVGIAQINCDRFWLLM